MSIDAKIRDVEEVAEGYLLHLEPRWERNYKSWSCCGQKQLLIINPTWKPEAGLAIWGGGIVLIETKPKARQYHQLGYTRLFETIEQRDKAALFYGQSTKKREHTV